MDIRSLLQEIDGEIAKLQRARDAIVQVISTSSPAKRRGRPPKSASTPAQPIPTKKRRTLSKAARAKIAAAQRKRWAKQKASGK